MTAPPGAAGAKSTAPGRRARHVLDRLPAGVVVVDRDGAWFVTRTRLRRDTCIPPVSASAIRFRKSRPIRRSQS